MHDRAARRALGLTLIATFAAFLDITLVNVAFADLRASFPETTLADLSWVINAYSVVIAALLVPAGRLADRVGRRRVFVGGLIVFLAGSALCAAAGSVAVLVAARVVQAAGAAILIPVSLALVLPLFPGERRIVATSAWAATSALAAATGPSLGGVLVDAVGWRAAFLVNLPLGAAVLLARRALPDSRDEGAERNDPLGAVLVAGTVGLLALAVVKGPDWGWAGTAVLGCLAAATAGAVALARHLARHPAPIISPALLRIRAFGVATASSSVFCVAFYALMLANVLFLVQVWGYSVLTAGFALTPGALAAVATARPAARLAQRVGPRPVVLAGGLLFATAAWFGYRAAGATPDYVGLWLPAQLASGAAAGILIATTGDAAVADLRRGRLATAMAVLSCARQIGAVLGVAVLVAVLSTGAPGGAFDDAYALIALGGVLVAACALGFAPKPAIAPAAIAIEGLERREVDVHGERWVVHTGGQGPVVLLVHGMLDSAAGFRRLGHALATRCTVVVPDLLGHGASDKPLDVDYTAHAQAAYLRDLLDVLGHERVVVAGHSYGGGVALTFATQHPERCAGLVLLASGGLGREVHVGLRLLAGPGGGLLLRLAGAAPLRALVTALAGRSRAAAELAGTLALLADGTSRHVFERMLRAQVGPRGQRATIRHRLCALADVPALVVWGRRDTVMPIAHASTLLDACPAARLVVVERAGHMVHRQAACEVADAVAEFVAPAAHLEPPATLTPANVAVVRAPALEEA